MDNNIKAKVATGIKNKKDLNIGNEDITIEEESWRRMEGANGKLAPLFGLVAREYGLIYTFYRQL